MQTHTHTHENTRQTHKNSGKSFLNFFVYEHIGISKIIWPICFIFYYFIVSMVIIAVFKNVYKLSISQKQLDK